MLECSDRSIVIFDLKLEHEKLYVVFELKTDDEEIEETRSKKKLLPLQLREKN